MSRWTKDPERAASDLIQRSLDAIGLSGRVLLANQACHLSPMLAERGTKVCAWNRRLSGRVKAAPWPPAGPYEAGLLRLPIA